MSSFNQQVRTTVKSPRGTGIMEQSITSRTQLSNFNQIEIEDDPDSIPALSVTQQPTQSKSLTVEKRKQKLNEDMNAILNNLKSGEEGGQAQSNAAAAGANNNRITNRMTVDMEFHVDDEYEKIDENVCDDVTKILVKKASKACNRLIKENSELFRLRYKIDEMH